MKRASFFLMLCILHTGCKEHSHDNKTVFRYNESNNITSLDPAFAKSQANIWGVNQLFSGLVQLDENLNIKPDIAKKWDISKDGKQYTFILRKDVFFHKHKYFGAKQTRKVTAYDFVYSLDRLKDKNTASPGVWVLQNIDSYKALNDSIFKISLKNAFPPFLGLLTMKYCSVVPKEIIELYRDDFGRNPIGTGAFKFKLWKENIKLVLLKNTLYYEKERNAKLPYLDAVAINFIPDKQSAFMEFIKGNIDFISGIETQL